MGRILTDPTGGVLENTLPVTLTNSLGSLPNAATGLVHLGNGRYYNPALGRPLQPNPAGGVPTVPQSLNRYAATSLGPVGVRYSFRDTSSYFTERHNHLMKLFPQAPPRRSMLTWTPACSNRSR